MRFTLGVDGKQELWDNSVQTTNYVLVNPGTQLVCECCFSKVEDIVQHTSKKAACSLFVASRHLFWCYQENAFSDFRPSPAVVSTMCLDEICPLTARDIVAQPVDWDPTKNFASTRYMGHTVNNDLANTSFQQLYNDYLIAHPDLHDDKNICVDIVTEACEKASSVNNLQMWMECRFDSYFQRRVEEEIAAGRLTRNQEAAPNQQAARN